VVHFHGGGFALGTPAQADWHSSGIAVLTPAVVVSVDYPLAPEHPFPAAIEYSWSALQYVVEHPDEFGGDPRHLALAGDSAGGNIAAEMAVRARDHAVPVCLQVLMYPVCDFTEQMDDYPSARENRGAPILPLSSVHAFAKAYLPAGDATDPVASPIRREDLNGLAPALIQTAQFDVLRDQGQTYAERLRAAGNNVVATNYPHGVHAYIGLPGIVPKTAKPARKEVVTDLRRAFAAKPTHSQE
jgi:acetyl esterase